EAFVASASHFIAMGARRLVPYGLGGALALTAFLAALAPGVTPSRAAPAAEATGLPGYQELLDRYLAVVSARGAPLETRFNYLALRSEPDHEARLAAIHARVSAARPSRMSDRRRLAWAINAYNFLVIETVTRHLISPPDSSGAPSARMVASVQEI